MTKQKRTYDNSLRRQQQEMTSTAIMVALRELILEGRIHNFTIQEVAARAGVSYGSVYRHYSSREAILEAFRNWSLEQDSQRIPTYVDRLEALPEWVEQMIPLAYKSLPSAKALFAALAASPAQSLNPRTRERDEWIMRLVREAAPNVADNIRSASYVVIRLLLSMSTWVELQARHGLDEQGIIAAVNAGISAQTTFLKSAEQNARQS